MLRASQFCIGRRPGCHTRLPIVRSRLRPSAAARIPIPRNPPPPVRRLFHTTPILFGSSPFNLHDVGEGIVEVEIIKWHVKEGQEVEEFDALVEVQSDKSVVELTSHATGKVRSINGEIGQMIKVGQTLCVIETDDPVEEARDDGASPIPDQVNQEANAAGQEQESGEEYNKSHESPAVAEAEELSEQLERASEPHPSSPPKPPKPPRKHPLDDSPSHEYLLQGQDAAMDASGPAQLSGEAAILPSAPRLSVPTHDGPVPERRARSEERKRIVKASPAVRTLAAKMGVELDDVKATGEGGRVTREDVQAASGSAASGEPRGAEQVAEQVVTRVEFGRTRKVMYKALGEQAKVPHFGYSHTLDLTNLLPYLRHSPPSTAKPAYLASDIPSNLSHDPLETFARPKKSNLLSFLVKAAVMALEEHPILRSRVKESGGDRWLEISRYGTIGVAVSDPKFGLLTPSLPPLSPSTSLSAVSEHLQHLRETASRPSPPPHLTISSVGNLGEARGAMPVLPPGGGLAICAVGRAKWEVEWKAAEGKVFGKSPEEVAGGGLRAVLRIPVGWSADHRVLEGAELIAFTETWRKCIEEPWRWLEPE